ncbi:hypothetical protein V5799_029359 [Amblyomma americanum]|uniref:Uncharacterized protein n=1 Tax=Amblyomma americanum TaxID=6943 RepID=A0AAQ4ER79_AMBAM
MAGSVLSTAGLRAECFAAFIGTIPAPGGTMTSQVFAEIVNGNNDQDSVREAPQQSLLARDDVLAELGVDDVLPASSPTPSPGSIARQAMEDNVYTSR